MANAVTAFLDDTIGGGAGKRPALVTPAGATTYRELLALVCRAGSALRGLGVEPEQRVAILLPDGVEWVVTFFGALRIGAVAVPLNTRLRPPELVAMLRDCRARVLVADAALLTDLRPQLTELPHLRAVVTTGGEATSLKTLLAAADPDCLPEAASGDDAAFWLYTSGTSAGPKAAIHLHRDLLACRHYAIDVLKASDEDRTFSTSKLFFSYALGHALLLPFYLGACAYLDPAWPEPASVAGVMKRFQPTVFYSVPTFYGRLLHSGLPRDTFKSVRACVSAGEHLPAELYTAWREYFGVELLDGLGLTETMFIVLANRPGKSRAGSVGQPVPGCEVRLLDSEGRAVPDGEPGVLHVRSPSMSPGYWNRVDLTRRAFVGDWFRTGDLMIRDADGFYRCAGRDDEMFKVAGMWVSPSDVEAALRTHPGVADAGVVEAAAEDGLMKPVAFVVSRSAEEPEALEAALAKHLADKLPSHQRPRRIRVVAELPRTVGGNLQRFVLREWAERTL